MKKVNHIGVLVFNNYEDNVILETLNRNELINILSSDKDVLRFEIRDISTNKTVYSINATSETKRESEHKGTTFNIFNKNPYKIHEKVKWVNELGTFKTKKLAESERLKSFELNLKNLFIKCENYNN